MIEEQRDHVKQRAGDQKGQTIILVALMLIALLGIVGLAVDVGLVFARNSQLSAAVDAAVLAGVTEVQILDQNSINVANLRAAQFLRSNNIPEPVITAAFSDPANSEIGSTIVGTTEYQITVTWPVDLFFLRVLGFQTTTLRKTATAGYFPMVDIFASRGAGEGIVGSSNNAIFGPEICRAFGDPFSPTHTAPNVPNDLWPILEGTYRYRILIPNDYPYDVVRVELFDPDSINRGNVNSLVITRTQAYVNTTGQPLTTTIDIPGDQRNTRMPATGETITGNNLLANQINPFWIWRIDENRGTGTRGQCGQPGVYTPARNTATLFELFYFRRNVDGSVDRIDLAQYTGQTGDGRDGAGTPGDHLTDLHWVSPGGRPNTSPTGRHPGVVPANCGNPTGGDWHPIRCPGGEQPGPGRGFEIRLSPDPNDPNPNRPWLQNILTDEQTGNRFIWLNVTALSGASENGYEIWAGPPLYTNSVPSDGNLRNVHVRDNPGAHSSLGVTVFAMGFLPMNSNTNTWTDIPLIYVGPEYAGETVSISMFDPDSGAQAPILFYFDSIAFQPLNNSNVGHDAANTDYVSVFGPVPGVPGHIDPDLDPNNLPNPPRCRIGGTPNCNDQWVTPAFGVRVPRLDLQACNALPTNDPERQFVCNPFYGGRLIARYQAGQDDSYAWAISMPSLPFLIR